MQRLGLERNLVDRGAYERTVERFRQQRVVLPTFGELAEPWKMPAEVRAGLGSVDPDEAHPLNLFRVHWHNDAARTGFSDVPVHVELPPALTGVDARIVLVVGKTFPLVRAHKVLAAYACLAPRVVTGQFDPTAHRAIWPSTGNYARGGVAISRIMGCRGVAVLPENMSRERFAWLDEWVADPDDIVRTPGSESNVKEIYDACNELAKDPGNRIFNQFCEFGNHLAHHLATGRAVDTVFESLRESSPDARLRAFVAATGSAGTLAAGDYLKDQHGSMTVAVEALECPTLLYNGFGEHNIQGIGDKHVPLIHNVMSTDVVTAVSDRSTDCLNVLFDEATGKDVLRRRGVPETVVDRLPLLGVSSICNLLAAIKVARHFRMGPDDVIMTVATDSAEMYGSEREKVLARDHRDGFGPQDAAAVYGEHVLGASDDHLVELTEVDRNRIFNLGYFTWVEQQGVSLEDFEARRQQSYWRDLRELVPEWDAMIEELNGRTGVLRSLAS